MSKPIPIFYNALLLTSVNLLLRLVGTGFQIYISRQMGASGVGLLQLTMSVGSLALITGMAGIRTGTMYLTAEELGKNRPGQVPWVLSGCIRYSLLFSVLVSGVLYFCAPQIALHWIRDPRTTDALRLFSAFLPVSCLCGVMTGCFTAAGRIRSLAAVEVAEQLFSMATTVLFLTFYAGDNAPRACQSVILGSGAGSCLTLACLTFLRRSEASIADKPTPIAHRLLDTALPLGAADMLKSGINTAENLMVPRRLALCPGISDPLAAFGILSGMVFPVVMFPAAILFALAELLIPELSRCAAASSRVRIRYLVRRGLGISFLYGIFFCGGILLLAQSLCIKLYGRTQASYQMQLYALLIPMLYCDALTDAMTKGLGQQKACVRYNILTSFLDVVILYLLLPQYGMAGYFFSFLITHLLNFILSLRRLLHITSEQISLVIPMLSVAAMGVSVAAGNCFTSNTMRLIVYCACLFSLWTILGIFSRHTLSWLKHLICASHTESTP